jgi:hypothetical protein
LLYVGLPHLIQLMFWQKLQSTQQLDWDFVTSSWLK